MRDDFSAGMAISVFRHLGSGSIIGAAPKPIPSMVHGFNPFGLVSECDAGYSVEIRLFLKATGIGEHDVCACQKSVHIKVTAWGSDRSNHPATAVSD